MKRNRIYAVVTGGFFFLMAWMTGGIGRTLLLICGGAVLFFSFIYYLGLPRELACRLFLPTYCKKGENIVGELRIEHRGLFPIFYGKAFLRIGNLLTKETETFDLGIVLMRQEEGSSSFDFAPARVGILEVELYKVELYGLLGCVKKSRKVSLRREVMVMPDTFDMRISLRPVLCMNEEGERTVRARNGFDPGIYDGIRPFRDGDSVRSIHWKLTGKMDEYVVRELGMPAIMLPVLYLETAAQKESCTPQCIDALLEVYISLSQALAEEGFRHCLCWYDRGQQRFIWQDVAEVAQLDEILGLLLRADFIPEERPHFFEVDSREWERYGQVIVVSAKKDQYDSFMPDPETVTLLLGQQNKDKNLKTERIYPFGAESYRRDLYLLKL